jgi:S-adenosylmethionine synthetase
MEVDSMADARYLVSSESVTEGHPDKLADQISDGVLDAIFAEDPMGRVACETFVTTGLVLVGGEITTNCYVDIPRIARSIIKEIGYTRAKYGFDGETCAVLTAIDEQSPDIAQGVDRALEIRENAMDDDAIDKIGAGDQGMMFGYACDETEEYLPAPIAFAHRLSRKLAEVRKECVLPYLRPDGKTQVTAEYVNGKLTRVDTIVVSSQHHPSVEQEQIAQEIRKYVIDAVIPGELLDDRLAPHGGGAFSGKDPTKVDRSAAYMARYAAKNIVAAGIAKRCQIQVAYAIGVARPVSMMVETFGTGKIDDGRITELVRKHFDFRPAAIIRDLDLRKPQYRRLAAYGHMGRIDLDPMPFWEKTDRAEALKAEL